MSVRSYSQYGEDLQIAYLLGRSDGVTYIDVGCLFPKDLSNSYYFYKRGGRGLCVDPNPTVAEAYAAERPRDRFLNVGISDRPGTLSYRMYENPVFNTFSDERADFVEASVKRKGRGLVDVVEVPVTTLAEAVRSTGFADEIGGRLDFMTIDVEGLEPAVIAGHDWELLRPRLVVTELIRRKGEEVDVEAAPAVRALKHLGYTVAAYTGHDVYLRDAR